MKPVIVHTAKYWYSSQNLWMTSFIMQSWMENHFIPDSRLFGREANLSFSILLLMDNAPCYPACLHDIHPNVKVLSLPPNTTSLVQPQDQEVICNVKNFNYTKVYNYLREKTKSNEEMRAIETEDLFGDLEYILMSQALMSYWSQHLEQKQ